VILQNKVTAQAAVMLIFFKYCFTFCEVKFPSVVVFYPLCKPVTVINSEHRCF